MFTLIFGKREFFRGGWVGCMVTEAKNVYTVEKHEFLRGGWAGSLVAWSLLPRLSTLLRNVSPWGVGLLGFIVSQLGVMLTVCRH